MATVEGPRAAARAALDAWGGIDILVNNAGIAVVEPLLEMTAEDWDLVQAVNLRAPFLLAQALAPGMIERRLGKIVNVSSQTSDIALVDARRLRRLEERPQRADQGDDRRVGAVQRPVQRRLPDRDPDARWASRSGATRRAATR